MRPHLALIDGPNHVFRAFHAIRRLTNSRGEPTNAIYGYVQMLRSVLRELRPTHAAVAFDPPDGTFRNAIYPDYKAHRPPMPEDLAVQWPLVFDVTRAFRLPLIRPENHEADDVIATLARRAEARDWDVTIVSTDKDLMQLVGPHVTMLDTMKGVRFDAGAVRDRWGVPPEQVRDLLALTGDVSDNIPGVPGIGPKTAAALIGQWGSLDGVLAHAGEIPQKKRRENLLAHADDARLSYRLVTLDEDAPVGVELDDLAVREPDRERLAGLFERLEFRRLLDEFTDRGNEEEPEETDSGDDGADGICWHVVADLDELACLAERLKQARLASVDLETTSLVCHDAGIVGLALAVDEGEGWYVPVGHRHAPGLDSGKALAALKPWLEDPGAAKCGHNLKYDEQVLWRAGVRLAGVRDDSMLLAYVDEPGQAVNMDAVALKYLGRRCVSYVDVVGKGAKQVNFADVSVDRAASYAVEDACVALRLTHELRRRLDGRTRRHDEIELPLSRVLAAMEWAGVRLDATRLEMLSRRFGEQLAMLEARIHEAAGEAFNIHSPRQLGVVLFEKLGLPGGKKTKSGQWATGQDVLERLAGMHEAPRLILEARQLAKLKSTYTDALVRLIHPETGRVHTSYNQAVTTTGRLSSSDPNLQNIPIRSAEGREIRKAFIAEEGCVLVSADYSQIELRLMAHFSGDEALCKAFAEGQDIHAHTAARVNGVALVDVTPDMRRQAKIINFGILYGMSPFGLARQLGMDRGEARAFIEAYFTQYPRVRAFLDDTLAAAREQGYVETLLGHRVPLPEIASRNGMRRAWAERTAINAPLQGSAADIIKVAMIRLHACLPRVCDGARMILQVHDELVVECPRGEAGAVARAMREEMESAVRLNVPLVVDIGQGRDWFSAHPV